MTSSGKWQIASCITTSSAPQIRQPTSFVIVFIIVSIFIVVAGHVGSLATPNAPSCIVAVVSIHIRYVTQSATRKLQCT